MKEIVLSKKSVKLKLGELTCEVREPTLRESQEYGAKLQKAGEEGNITEIESFLIHLGASEEIISQLTPRMLTEILEELTPQVKK